MFPFTSQGFGGAAVGSRFDMPSAMKYLRDHVSEDESVLMMDNLIFPYEYYKRRFDTAFKVVFLQSPRNEKISDESAQSALMQGAGENGLTKGLWVVVGNVRWVRRGLYDNPREHIHAALNRMGHVTDMIEFHNITIFYLKEMIKHN
jgi:hypothetical protein